MKIITFLLPPKLFLSRLIDVIDDFLLELKVHFWKHRSQSDQFRFKSKQPKNQKWCIQYHLLKANAYISSGIGFDGARPHIIEAHKAYRDYFEKIFDRNIDDVDQLFLDPGWATNVGHIAMLSIFPKLERVGLSSTKEKMLFVINTANNALLDLYKTYFTIVKVEPKSFLTQKYINRSLLMPMGAFETSHGVIDEYQAHNLAEKSYLEYSNGAPFFSTSLIDSDLALKGLPPEIKGKLLKPFVTLHVRSAPARKTRSANNSDIEDYVPAIEYLLKEGLVVIRIGDSSMPPLPNIPTSNGELVDYAYSEFRSPYLDVFLWSHAKFSICTSSGPAWIPNEFGVPTLLTNAPHLSMIYGINGYFIPHKYRSAKTDEFVSYKEIVESGFGSSWAENSAQYYRERNSSNEILEAVQSMHEHFILNYSIKQGSPPNYLKHNCKIEPRFHSNYSHLF